MSQRDLLRMSFWLLFPRDHPNFRQAVIRLVPTRDTKSILPFEQPLFFLMRLVILFFGCPTLAFGIVGITLLFYSAYITQTPC